ncbi:hypothetical protein HDU97_001485 [Phlyctochytrium planicorne]|nr:hypothetical protein HDU97_001485 [Phlyctochytrium planicorne]
MLPVELLEAILIHLVPPSPPASSECKIHLNVSGIRPLLHFSAASTELKRIIESSDLLWRTHWEAIFDPCYNGVVRFPSIDELPARLELRTLKASAYQRRIKQRRLALNTLASTNAIEEGKDVSHAFVVVADMCRESVSKNRRLVGEMLHAETFFKFFEKDFGAINRGVQWGPEAAGLWPLNVVFFQVLAHFITYGKEVKIGDEELIHIGLNIEKVEKLLVRTKRNPRQNYYLSEFLGVEYGLGNPFSSYHTQLKYLLFVNAVINIRHSKPNFLPPSPIRLPVLLSSRNSWQRLYFTGNFAGFRQTYEGRDKVTPEALAFDAKSISNNSRSFSSMQGANIVGFRAWDSFHHFDATQGTLKFRQADDRLEEARYELHVSEFGMVGVLYFTAVRCWEGHVLYWKEKAHDVEWPSMEKFDKAFADNAKARWRPDIFTV